MSKYPILEDDEVLRDLKRYTILFAVILSAVIIGSAFFFANSLSTSGDWFQPPEEYRPPQVNGANATDEKLKVLRAQPVRGQTVYVPASSHVYHGKGRPQLLTITLNVRNTSSEHDIVINSARYYDTNGKAVRSYLNNPLRLSPLTTIQFLVERNDTSSGSRANFIVEWVADQAVPGPVVKALMFDSQCQQGIPVVRGGKSIREFAPEDVQDGTGR